VGHEGPRRRRLADVLHRRAAGVAEPNAGGAIGLATSPTSATGPSSRPVFVGGYGQLEVPQVFEHQGRWFCLFCTAAEHFSAEQARDPDGGPVTGNHYLIGDGPRGPWRIAPGLPRRRAALPALCRADRRHGQRPRPARICRPTRGRFLGHIMDPEPVPSTRTAGCTSVISRRRSRGDGKGQAEDVRKSFGTVEVIKGVDIDIEDGEFVVFVGPSGCGKSTLLRMIAGLEDITGGTLEIDGKVVNDLAPKERGIAMVFQTYAIFPHMTVRENVAFGLTIAGAPKAEKDAKVAEAARILQMEHLLDRRPSQLSGGQRQRVAIGRAIVRKPKVFLFDEPLSNLDAALRMDMRMEIGKLHQSSALR
jgi:ABC-type nitrate/sulfonate/bicarbonate transport system ATPase subunit